MKSTLNLSIFFAMGITAELISAEAEIGISVFEEAKERINAALKEFKGNHASHT